MGQVPALPGDHGLFPERVAHVSAERERCHHDRSLGRTCRGGGSSSGSPMAVLA